jgi:hypothetical protein
LIWFRLYAEREARSGEVEDEVTAPGLAAPAPAQPVVEESAVHFDSFSGMLRAGQTIRPARPITTPFEEPAEAAPVVPPVSRFKAPAPNRRALLPYALIGLLLIAAISIFAISRRRTNVDEQRLGAPTASPLTSSSDGKPSRQPLPTVVADNDSKVTNPTPASKVTPSPDTALEARATETEDATPTEGSVVDTDTREAINATINGVLSATNDKNVDAQMQFYAPVLRRYYLRNNYSRAAVRAEKARLLARADSVQMSAGEPEISLEQNGRAARVRFRKDYEITSNGGTQRGAVLQELLLIKRDDDWHIVSERDLRVLR